MKSKLVLGLFIITGICISSGLNLLFTQYILIPDPCYYHSNDMNPVMDFFFDLTAAAGFHPIPSLFNVIFTLVFGVLMGYTFWNKKNELLNGHKNENIQYRKN